MIPQRFQTLQGLKVFPSGKPPTADSANQARRLAPLNYRGIDPIEKRIARQNVPFGRSGQQPQTIAAAEQKIAFA